MDKDETKKLISELQSIWAAMRTMQMEIIDLRKRLNEKQDIERRNVTPIATPVKGNIEVVGGFRK